MLEIIIITIFKAKSRYNHSVIVMRIAKHDPYHINASCKGSLGMLARTHAVILCVLFSCTHVKCCKTCIQRCLGSYVQVHIDCIKPVHCNLIG